MIESEIEEFKINNCPLCGKVHIVKVDVHRNLLKNDINKDIRVPEFKRIKVPIICPIKNENFSGELHIQEDIYSKIIKLCKVDIEFFNS